MNINKNVKCMIFSVIAFFGTLCWGAAWGPEGNPEANKMLWDASLKGKLDLVKQALREGANIDAVNPDSIPRKKTALIIASESGHNTIVKELLDRRANIEAVDEYGSTALMRAAFLYYSVVDTLLNAGARVDRTNNYGTTALGIAGHGYFLENSGLVIDRLIRAGADINVALKNEINRMYPRLEVILLFIKYGADISSLPPYERDKFEKIKENEAEREWQQSRTSEQAHTRPQPAAPSQAERVIARHKQLWKDSHYDVLELDMPEGSTSLSSITLDDIKTAYRGLARKFHPDKSKAENALEKMKRINVAYETLSDSEKRARYDLMRMSGW